MENYRICGEALTLDVDVGAMSMCCMPVLGSAEHSTFSPVEDDTAAGQTVAILAFLQHTTVLKYGYSLAYFTAHFI